MKLKREKAEAEGRRKTEQKAKAEEAERQRLKKIEEEELENKRKFKAFYVLGQVFAKASEAERNDFKILVLGGTGQGKTTFLNFLLNAQQATESI